MGEVNSGGDQDEYPSHQQVWRFHRAGLSSAIRLHLGGAHQSKLRRSIFHTSEDQRTAKEWRDRCSDCIKRLSKIQSALGALCRSQDSDVGIRCHFEKTLATSHYEEGYQEE